MKIPNRSLKAIFLFLAVLLVATVMTRSASCALIDEKEALAMADLWYAMEINSERTKMDPREKADRLDDIRMHDVFYFVGKDDFRAGPPKDGRVMGYVVKYHPTGYVVVSGEDRIEPILAFDARSPFEWELPRGAFMQDYLAYALAGRFTLVEERLAQKKKVGVHPEWTYLRSRLGERKSLKERNHEPRDGRESVYAYYETALWDQMWPYNET